MSLFNADLKRGRAGEQHIMEVLARAGHEVSPASVADDRTGIDFWVKAGPFLCAVQVKTDTVAARTGNLFIETVSVDTQGKPGWAETPRADFIVYYIPPRGLAYIIPMRLIRESLPAWKAAYPTRCTAPEVNNGYQTHGVTVPIREFASCEVLSCA